MLQKSDFLLDDALAFLNHGSFGACPRAVLEVQSELRARLERNPMQFFMREYFDRLGAAREVLADFVGARAADLVFVRNASQATSAVLASWPLEAGDEIVTTTHAYGAVKNAMAHYATRAGATVVTAEVALPIATEDDVVSAIESVVTARTKLVVVDHITSPTGVVFPVAQIAERLTARDIPLFVDGAHCPGQIALDLKSLGAAMYTGNCHKWLFAPKGSAFLVVDERFGDLIRPNTISHRADFQGAFDWTGTDDVTSWLSIPTGIAAVDDWDAHMARNHELVTRARARLLEVTGSRALCPESMLAALASIELEGAHATGDIFAADPLQMSLVDEGIEVPIFPFEGRRLLRVSTQVYNTMADYERLARAL